MTTHTSFAGAIRDLGRAIGELYHVDRSGLSRSEQPAKSLSTVDEWIEHAQGTDYWRSWNQIVDILSRYDDDYSVERTVGSVAQVCWPVAEGLLDAPGANLLR